VNIKVYIYMNKNLKNPYHEKLPDLQAREVFSSKKSREALVKNFQE